jgi:hypothetical protein
LCQVLRQIGIELDGDNPIRTGQQALGECATARSDLHNQGLTLGTSGASNTFEDRTANEEVLAEFLARHRQPRTV